MAHGWHHLERADEERILRGIEAGDRALGGPFHIEFDWTDRCNVHCFFCHNDLRNAAGRDLDPAIIRSSMEYAKANGLRSVRLSGGGESLFHRRIDECLDILLETGVPIDNLTTNAVLLNERNAAKLLAIGMDEVIVSLNYTTPELYARHMETSPRNFERALEGTRLLRELPLPEGKPRPSIVLQFTLHGPTRFEVPRMMEIADDLDADRVLIRDLYRVDQSTRIPEADKPRVREDLREALRADRGRGRLHISLPDEGLDGPWEEHLRSLAESAGTPNEERTPNEFCHMPWYSVAIRGNGDAFICCMLMIEEEAKPLGNLNDQSLADLWHGPALATIRREMERVMICDTRLDPGRQGFEFLFPICTQHRACPLAFSLSAPEFYDEAEAIHRRKRRTLRGLLTRLRHGSRRRRG